MMIPHRRTRGDGFVVFKVPFDRGWVDAVKAAVPGPAREWDPGAKEWAVAPGYAPLVADLTRRTFGYRVDDAPGSGTHRRPGPDPLRRHDDDYAVLHLLSSAPLGLIETAYKHLARERHPDRGGDHEGMLVLNAAVARLRDRAAL